MTREQPEAEYIVVGSGAGGGPLAANLAKAGFKVLLLEAGDDAADDYNCQVPCFHAFASEDGRLKWDFFVRHYASDERQRRDPKFVPERDGVLYPRAGTLGGCTVHNAMITLYPHNSDWDHIAKVTGDSSWASGKMRQYFERIERCEYQFLRKLIAKLFRYNPSRHGFGGWLATNVADPDLMFPDQELKDLIWHSVEAALRELELPLLDKLEDALTVLDPNDWRLVQRSAQGIRQVPLATRGGRRIGPREYLEQVAKDRPDRLILRTGALATRVLFGEGNRAVGIEYRAGQKLYRAANGGCLNGGEEKKAYASREVILAGGAFNSPQLLMLSGIGPKEHLDRFGIPVRVDLPGVGQNLQDRYEVGIVNRVKKDFGLLKGATFDAPVAGCKPDPIFAEWLRGKGVYTTNGAVISVITRSAASRPEPDLYLFGLAGLFRGYFPGYSKLFREHKDYFTWGLLKAHTNNTAGQVTLRSNDPLDVPQIDFHYFDEGNDASGDDLESVVNGIELARVMTRKACALIEEEELPGDNLKTRDQLRQFVKDHAWGHHASCTNKMGAPGDRMAVVDSSFRVYGTQGLRVVDASVFPRIPGFFIVTPIYMISEKASDVIAADARK
ncbi:MAG TPA: GMC oxidoreductase [Thermoanaerobaculia bacterium]|nr:GMC oxidoreductase [Thermoanaerobaculia bacterium]